MLFRAASVASENDATSPDVTTCPRRHVSGLVPNLASRLACAFDVVGLPVAPSKVTAAPLDVLERSSQNPDRVTTRTDALAAPTRMTVSGAGDRTDFPNSPHGAASAVAPDLPTPFYPQTSTTP